MQPTAAARSLPTETHPASTAYLAELEVMRAQFQEKFGDAGNAIHERTYTVRAPGRVNLIGEHTDYNDGFVLPMAVEPEVRIICRARDDGKIRLVSTAFPGELAEFSVQQKITRGQPAWADYARGVAALMVGAGIPLSGMDALIHNTLAVGSGLSSSAAIEVAVATSLLKLAGLDMERQRLALLCQKAEHEFAGVPCGIMDQTIVAGGKAGHAMLLDCRDLSKQYVPVDPMELRVVIVNSMTRHALTGGEYAERRGQCEQGVAHFAKSRPQVKALRDVTLEELEAARNDLPADVYRRCRHVVSEIARTVKAAGLLVQRDYDEVGQLMLLSHQSLRDDFEVSTVELDALVEEAMKVRGVYGARMTGAGFGGCVVLLAQPREVETISAHIKTNYNKRFGKIPEIYVTTATAGADIVQ